MERVGERLGGNDNALLEHGRSLRVAGVDGADEIEGFDIHRCQGTHLLFKNAELPDVQLAELGHEVDIGSSANGMSDEMAAMEVGSCGIWVPCHAARITRVFAEDGLPIGHNCSLQIDVEDVGEHRVRALHIDGEQLG